MKQDIAELWARELPKYKQGKHRMRNGDRFCCLGVLCNLHAQTHPKFAKTQTNPDMYDGAFECLPEVVMQWVGMRSADGKYAESCGSLAWDNDSGVNFDTIAEIILKRWKEL